MANDADIAKMEFALKNPNVMRYGGKTKAYSYTKNNRNKTADTVLYEMYMGAQSYYVVQAVPDTQAKTLFIVSAFIGDQGYAGKTKKGTSQLNDANAPPRTSKNDFVIVPTKSIPQTNPVVNTSEEKNIDKADLTDTKADLSDKPKKVEKSGEELNDQGEVKDELFDEKVKRSEQNTAAEKRNRSKQEREARKAEEAAASKEVRDYILDNARVYYKSEFNRIFNDAKQIGGNVLGDMLSGKKQVLTDMSLIR